MAVGWDENKSQLFSQNILQKVKVTVSYIMTVLDASYYAYCGGQEKARRLGGRVLNITLLMTQLGTEN